MAYLLFLLANAALFIRPSELLAGLEEVQFYQILIFFCMLLASLDVVKHFSELPLRKQPLMCGMLALFFIVVFSLVVKAQLDYALDEGLTFFKIVIYFGLLVALVNTPARLRGLLYVLTLCALVVCLLAVLQFHGLINIPSLTAMEDNRQDARGNIVSYVRLRGTGIFNDPNDFTVLLVLAVPMAWYWLSDPQLQMQRGLWLAALALFLYALWHTQSRGGILAIFIAGLIVARTQYGKAVTTLVLILGLVGVAALFAVRQTDWTGGGGDTSQERFHQWQEAITHLKYAPLTGIGAGGYMHMGEYTLVAHNTYLHLYAELGLPGGTVFLGMIYFSIVKMRQLSRYQRWIFEPELQRLQPYIFGMVCGLAALIMTLSRCYIVPLYLFLGLAQVQLNMAWRYTHLPELEVDSKLLQTIALVSLLFLACMYVAMRVLVRY